MAVNKKIPQSRLMIQYDTRVEGEPKKKELPYRLLVIGDLSKGKSKDAKKEFEDRSVRVVKNGIDAALKDMDISANISVPNSINPQKSAMLNINYKFNSVGDFQPDKIAKKVPELNALLKLKEMLSSFEKDIDNNRTLKKTIDKIFSNKEALSQLKTELPQLDSYRLHSPEPEALEGEVLEKEKEEDNQ
ncbi:type VI secretion system contractile sheath small subunit [Fangia hongkongensis]|uniref:type VI secretion system contractile sheath small subunit n=1 Tax=Fangia hongkongensis TaxID=270495 RepID=UPI0003669B6D|nr:type VI secretion system contractile sheath small subunit [Fangia hongkongensis]MBK2125037.1 type VI secretion system contractile sheath small subunit [Fangia hongkongensis]